MATDFTDPNEINLYRPRNEREFQRDIVQAAQSRGWLCYWHNTQAPTRQDGKRIRDMGTPGMADLIMCRENRLIFAELKVGKNKVTENQRRWLEALNDTPAEVYIFYPSDWETIVGVLS